MYSNAFNVRTLAIAAALAILLAVGAAGIAYANNGGSSEEQLTGPEAKKAKSAALAAAGGGTVTGVERDDGDGTGGAFEVEVARQDGSQLEVHLDGDYNVVGRESDEDGINDED